MLSGGDTQSPLAVIEKMNFCTHRWRGIHAKFSLKPESPAETFTVFSDIFCASYVYYYLKCFIDKLYIILLHCYMFQTSNKKYENN